MDILVPWVAGIPHVPGRYRPVHVHLLYTLELHITGLR